MRCPFCGFEDTKVIDSRPAEGKKRRRRECTNCGKRFTTYESVEMPLLLVMKKDNSFEPFDRNKLIRGLTSAVKKRPVSIENITQIVDGIESYYANKMQTQTTSSEIGDTFLHISEPILSLCPILPKMRPSGEVMPSIASTEALGLNRISIEGSPFKSTYCVAI